MAKPLYLVLWASLTALFLALLVAIPAWTIPGNDFAFQLEILNTGGFLLLTVLALLMSLLITMHCYLLRTGVKERIGPAIIGQAGVGGLSAVAASIFGTATCGACLSSIFGFLGFGGVLFLLDFRWYIVSGAIILTVISLYFAVRKVNGACEACAGKNVISGY